MTPREMLIPNGLDVSRPGFARLLRAVVTRLPEAEAQRIRHELGPRPPLLDLWNACGGRESYGYAIEPFDVDPGCGPQDAPALSDDCFRFVRIGRRGRRALALGLTSHASNRHFAVSDLTSSAAHLGLAYAPRKDGVFRSARFVAAVRGRPMQPEDLVAILGINLTPILRAALNDLGFDFSPLEAARIKLATDLGHAAIARLREVTIFPPGLLALPSDWRLDAVSTTCGLRLVRTEEVLLPDLDALWLVSRYLWHTSVAGVPPVARTLPLRPLPTAHAVVQRYAARGWVAVFAGALRASRWQHSMVACNGFDADELVRRGLARLPLMPETPAHVQQADPVTLARSEYAELWTALSSRIIGRDVVDRLALVALAHRRGTSSPILFTGPSGAGKSYMARMLAEVVGVPFYLHDTTGLTEAGYRGVNVSDLVGAMYRNAGSDIKALEASVLFLDEIDKIRIGVNVDGVSLDKRWGVQAGLLNLLDGKSPIVTNEGSLTVRTSRILMICAGAFSDAAWSLQRAPTTTDLVQYGLIRELAERLRDRILLPARNAEQLVQLLQRSDESVEAVIGPLAAELGIELRVLPSAYAIVARMVAEERGGLGPRSGNQLLVAAGQRALLRALADDSEPVALVTPDDVDLLLHSGP
jgi:hypothetical protein